MPSLHDLKPGELVTKVHALLESGADYFALLGVNHSASPAEVKQSFVRLARNLHPDLPAFGSAAAKARATQAFQAVTRAQMILTDPARREEYLRELGIAPTDGATMEPNPELARIHMHRARQLSARRDWQGAEESLRLADLLFGEEPHDDCKVELGWAIFNTTTRDTPEKTAEAKAIWEAVIEGRGEPSAVAQAYYYSAIWCKLNGEVPKVKKFLENCLSIDERHVEAKRELRLFERRRASSASRRPTGVSRRATGSSRRESSSARRKTSITGEHGDAPAVPGRPDVKKVPLKRRTSFLERIFGKGE